MCGCGCELAIALAVRQAAEAAPAQSRSAARPDAGVRRDGATLLTMMLRALLWWREADAPLARLDRWSGR